MELAKLLPESPHYELFFDNYFTSLQIIDKLSSVGIGGTGTIRSNRITRCPFIPLYDMKKKEEVRFTINVMKSVTL